MTAAEAVGAKLPALVSGTAMISHVKCAEDGNGIIVRITECGGQHTTAKLTVPGWVKTVCRTNMAEKTATPADLQSIPLKPFEIATIRLTW